MLRTVQMMESIKTVMEVMPPMAVVEAQPMSVTIHVYMQMTMYVMMEERVHHLMTVLLEQIVLIVDREILVKNHAHHGTHQHIPITGFVKMEGQTAATVPAIEEQTV